MHEKSFYEALFHSSPTSRATSSLPRLESKASNRASAYIIFTSIDTPDGEMGAGPHRKAGGAWRRCGVAEIFNRRLSVTIDIGECLNYLRFRIHDIDLPAGRQVTRGSS
jgi:hypothetical protein